MQSVIDRLCEQVRELETENARLREEKNKLQAKVDVIHMKKGEQYVLAKCEHQNELAEIACILERNELFRHVGKAIEVKEEAEQSLAQAVTVIKFLEWSGEDSDGHKDTCPVCRMGKEQGHGTSCNIGNVIKRKGG